jgi:hypothetical protein
MGPNGRGTGLPRPFPTTATLATAGVGEYRAQVPSSRVTGPAGPGTGAGPSLRSRSGGRSSPLGGGQQHRGILECLQAVRARRHDDQVALAAVPRGVTRGEPYPTAQDLHRRLAGFTCSASDRPRSSAITVWRITCSCPPTAVCAARPADPRRAASSCSRAGFDDIEDGRFAHPSLTTVEPGRGEIAGSAVALLVERLNGTPASSPAASVVAGFLLHVRESTAG